MLKRKDAIIRLMVALINIDEYFLQLKSLEANEKLN